MVPGSAVLGAVKLIQEYPFSSGSKETLVGEITCSQSGAPLDIEIDNTSLSLPGFKNSIAKLAWLPGKISITASSAIIIPIDVLLLADSEILLFS